MLHDDSRDLRGFFSVYPMPDAGVEMQFTAHDSFMHNVRVADGRHAVVLAPEDIGRHTDVFKDGAQILGRHVDHRFTHDGGSFFVVMHAHQFVEQFFAEGLKPFKSRNLKKEFSRFGKQKPCDALEVTGMADAGGGAQVQMGNGEALSFEL